MKTKNLTPDEVSEIETTQQTWEREFIELFGNLGEEDFEGFVGFIVRTIAVELDIPTDVLIKEHQEAQKDPLSSGNMLKSEWNYLKSKRG